MNLGACLREVGPPKERTGEAHMTVSQLTFRLLATALIDAPAASCARAAAF